MLDKIIIGAGLYGLDAALFCGERGQKVLVIEQESAPFTRATYINQARVHMGYHYPRSLSTAMKSAGYFKRFVEDYQCCIHSEFDQIYATSSHFSWTDAKEFRKFCKQQTKDQKRWGMVLDTAGKLPPQGGTVALSFYLASRLEQ